MNKLAAPALLAVIAATQAGCFFQCYAEPTPVEPAPHRSQRIAQGDWILELDDVARDGRCGDIDPDELRRLHAFVQHRGEDGLFIDIEGLQTRGEQHGAEVNTYGALHEDIAVEEEPYRGEDEEEDTDTDADDCGEDEEAGGGHAPPCVEDREDEGRGDSIDEPLEHGVAVTLSGLADGPRWMEGDLYVDVYEAGRVTCTVSAYFAGHAVGDRD